MTWGFIQSQIFVELISLVNSKYYTQMTLIDRKGTMTMNHRTKNINDLKEKINF